MNLIANLLKLVLLHLDLLLGSGEGERILASCSVFTFFGHQPRVLVGDLLDTIMTPTRHPVLGDSVENES